MRRVLRVGVVLLLALVLANSASAQTASEPRFRLNASLGPSFANLGTSFSTTAGADLRVTDRLSLTGELGFLPDASIDEASRLVTVPVADPDDGRLSAYHWNGNLKFIPIETSNISGYVTAGVGGFTADAVVEDAALGGAGATRRMRTDFATNVGAGAIYHFNDWLGLQLDYRTFFVNREGSTPRVHRFVTGLALGG